MQFVDILAASDPHQPQMPPRQPHLFYFLLLMKYVSPLYLFTYVSFYLHFSNVYVSSQIRLS